MEPNPVLFQRRERALLHGMHITYHSQMHWPGSAPEWVAPRLTRITKTQLTIGTGRAMFVAEGRAACRGVDL